jgi:serine/threonine protein kinase
MSPEQIAGRRIDHRADLFALGVLLFEMLTGTAPFTGDDLHTVLYQVANVTPPPPSTANHAVSTMLDLVVAKALAKEPDARYQTAQEFAVDLRACTTGKVGEQTVPMARSAPSNTAASAAGTTRIDIGAETTPRLAISRRFDSTAALRRLAATSGTDGLAATIKLAPPRAAATAKGIRLSAYARRRRRAKLWSAAGVTIAAILAVVIALG